MATVPDATLREFTGYALIKPIPDAVLREFTAYALTKPIADASIREFTGYALVNPPLDATLREFTGYALVAPINRTHFANKGEVSLLNMINKQYGMKLTATDVSFSAGRDFADSTYNSKIDLVAKSSFTHKGTMTFRYNRFNLERAFTGMGLSLPSGNQTTIHERLPAINTAYGIALQPEDIVDATISSTATSLTLEIKSGSRLYVPGTKVTLTA